MKKLIYLLLGSTLMFTSCMKHDFDNNYEKEQVEENVKNVFGVSFDKNHDWCTTTVGSVTVTDIPSGTEKIQVLAYVDASDSTTTLSVLNEANVKGKTSVTLNYDIPKVNKGIYVSNGSVFKKVEGNTLSLAQTSTRAAKNRSFRAQENLVISTTVESFANKRGWIKDEVLYGMSDEAYVTEGVSVADYDDEYKTLFRTIIFSYFKNGRQYNNLPLIKESGYFNEKVYPITTGGEPIILFPVYKSDKATKYGNEIWNSDLYYYYFKESDLEAYVANGGNEVEFLTKLPKYKAIQFNQHFGENEDDVISKRTSYTLVYWGDGIPTIGTEGTYEFPSGYKIGFMVRAKTTADGGKKQGELYGDGRLNNKINFWGNFKSSNLGTDGPRMGWINLNGKMLLCCESGTDSDFNDIIIEVEGGVEEIPFIPEFESEIYTFCFEDRTLGDYDMNDIVIKASRINETTVEYSVVACGANDLIYIFNIGGNVINENTEVHAMFNVGKTIFVNTVRGQEYEPITERVSVSKDFSFLNADTQPYIYDATMGTYVHVSRVGEDPHGIMIPNDFKYPLERVCIKDAYPRFNEWGMSRITSTDWYKYYDEELVY